MSHAPSTYEVTWEHTKKIAQRAEELGFEALVPIARWRGFGGSTNFNGNCFETYTWAAGLAEATRASAIFATSHLPTVHPIVAAKAATTIDHISGGPLRAQPGDGLVQPRDGHVPRRAARARRALHVRPGVDRPGQEAVERGGLVQRRGHFFEGENLEAYPKPHQAPRPVLINAGNSPSGVEFSARNVDINFASLDTLENMANYTKSLRDKAREEYDRDISTMTYGLVVVRDTEQEAKKAFQSVIDHGDWDAAGNVMKVAGMESQSFNEQIKQFQERFIAGWAGYPVVGTPEQVVEELGRLNEAGMEGMIMGFVDYFEEMEYFGERVLPLMKEAGLRH